MFQEATYRDLYDASVHLNWRIEDILGGDGSTLDFGRPFMPETFVRSAQLPFLSPAEKLTLNHIRAHGYLSMFGLVEEFILPFVLEHARSDLGDDSRNRALLNFAQEEAKHIELFRTFHREFVAGFGHACGFIGPADEISRAILGHEPLAVAIAVLGIEWMSQCHYLESVRDDQDLDPHFKSLLKHHWMEECQHARLDGLMLNELAARASPEDIARAVDGYFDIGGFFDAGLKSLAELDLASFETATGRALRGEDRSAFLSVQHQALRWTFLGSAMTNKQFLAALGALGGDARARVEGAAPMFS
ncbi:MAG: hypothetical protein GC189_07120 [Alphaproteobacteria bacterium]|nr:hypothetical protein [Alphaproteobacteria bacterium]